MDNSIYLALKHLVLRSPVFLRNGGASCYYGVRGLNRNPALYVGSIILLRSFEHIRRPIARSVAVAERPLDLDPLATMARPQLTTLDPAIEERLTLESFEVLCP